MQSVEARNNSHPYTYILICLLLNTWFIKLSFHISLSLSIFLTSTSSSTPQIYSIYILTNFNISSFISCVVCHPLASCQSHKSSTSSCVSPKCTHSFRNPPNTPILPLTGPFTSAHWLSSYHIQLFRLMILAFTIIFFLDFQKLEPNSLTHFHDSSENSFTFRVSPLDV